MSKLEHKTFQKIVLDCPDSTIVCDDHKRGFSSEYYETEQAIEGALMKILEKQGYERVKIKGEDGLLTNLRRQLERLNSQRILGFKFTDSEWNRFYSENFKGAKNTGVENRTKLIQLGDCIVELKRDDGKICNITLFDKKRPQHNCVQVMNQFVDAEVNKRYDVTILINGLPLVQIELKKRDVTIHEAFKQINQYKKEAFTGLFEFIQIFVISNGSDTKYFSNTAKHSHNKKSIKFASNWGYADGKYRIRDIIDFAHTFLNKRTLLEILAKYCVLDLRGDLKILRPYQIAAIERILCQINRSINTKPTKPNESTDSGGYIWHTTGSGKTLTSFKAAKLALEIPEVKKVLFVVDRKDLDSQTYSEYKSFLGDAEDQTIDHTKNTNALKELLNDEVPRIIVTTIQKLGKLLNEKDNLNENLKKEKIVIISDECHRSQTDKIKGLLNRRFEGKSWFGFTGTPLLKNRVSGEIYDGSAITFGDRLHQYTIVNAIRDEKVLPFLVSWKYSNQSSSSEFFSHPARIESIVKYIISSFDRRTINRQFNSMFAVESIPAAIKYYREFQKQQQEFNGIRPIKVAVIFSPFTPSKNDEDEQIPIDETTSEEEKKEALKEAMQGYNKIFNSDISDFNRYRESISEKTKNKEIDILIVVDMFLTGFDAPRLNTLWLDKNLKEHGLIQAFSRTNRIVTQTKTYGNIVCFRNLRDQVKEAVLLFSLDPEDRQAVLGPGYQERISKYTKSETDLLENFPLDKEIIGEQAEREFMATYAEFAKNLTSVLGEDRFLEDRKMTDEQILEYKSRYIDLRNKYSNRSHSSNEDCSSFPAEIAPLEDDMLQMDSTYIDLDYIQKLINEYKKNKVVREDEKKEMKKKIMTYVGADVVLHREKKIIESYMDNEDIDENVSYQDYKKQEFEKEIDQLIRDEGLQYERTKEWIDKFVEERKPNFYGTKIQGKIMPKMDKTTHSKEYNEIWNRVKNRIEKIFNEFNIEKYW